MPYGDVVEWAGHNNGNWLTTERQTNRKEQGNAKVMPKIKDEFDAIQTQNLQRIFYYTVSDTSVTVMLLS